jgi:hypothetical protein
MILCRENNQLAFSNKDYSKKLHMPPKADGIPLSWENL